MDSPNKKYDVVIAGAGVIGCSIAYFLARESVGKLRIAVIDRDGIGGETSAGAAGMLAAQIESDSPGPFLNMAIASRNLFPLLSKELYEFCGVDIEYIQSGILEVAYHSQDKDLLKKRLAWQKKSGLECAWFPPEKIQNKFPFLEKRMDGGFWVESDGQVSSNRLALGFAESAKKLGVNFFENEDVAPPDLIKTELQLLKTNKQEFSAGQFIFTAGSWTGKILKIHVPVKPVKGQILIFETPRKLVSSWAAPIFLGKTPESISCYIVPKKDGHIYLGATAEDSGFDKTENKSATESMLHYAYSLFPDLSSALFKGVWVGLRPDTPDHKPILGLLPGFRNVYAASGHYRNGILLAPITGKIFAELILKKQTSFPIEPFSPERFS